MRISLKYKILGVLILLPALALIVFSFMTNDVFLKDKMAYVYETSFNHNKSLVKNTKYKYEKFSSFLKYYLLLNQVKNSANDLDFLISEKMLIGSKIFKNENGKISLLKSYRKDQDLNIQEIKISYQELYNQLPDRAEIDFNSPSPNVIRIFYKDDLKGLLAEGLFDLSTLSESFLNDKLYNNFLVLRNHTLFKKNDSKIDVNKIIEKIKKRNNTEGVFESQEMNAIISYGKVMDDVWVISLLDKEKALSVFDILKTKSLLFIIAIISLSAFLSVIASRTLTGSLRELSKAAQEIGQGDFHTHVHIKSKDEVGVLAVSFNDMSAKISKLLQELEEYNRTLEIKVDERTFELKQAMDLQNTILDSVDQGFVLINKDLNILPIYSKASEKIFDGKPNEKKLPTLLHLESTKADEIETYFNMAIEEMMPFNDMMMTAPSHFLNKDKREVFLQYMPVRDENNKVDKVVLVATDKTDEIEALKNLENQKSKVSMILKLASNAKSYLKFDEQTRKSISSLLELSRENSDDSFDLIARIVHTIKGNSAVYSLKKIVELSHALEESFKISGHNEVKLQTYLSEIESILDEIRSEYNAILNPGDSANSVQLMSHEVKEISSLLDAKRNIDAMNFLKFVQNSTLVKDSLNSLKEEAQVVAEKLSKKIQVNVEGEYTRIPEKRFDELFSNLIHLVRNGVDHGIETSKEREKNGKSPIATLTLSVLTLQEQLIISVTDDGKGIDTDKLIEKLIEKGIDVSAIAKDKIPYMIFNDGVSTSDQVSDISGRGVGVSAVKDVVDNMGGTIEIQTKKGAGTRFIIKVPLKNENLEVSYAN